MSTMPLLEVQEMVLLTLARAEENATPLATVELARTMNLPSSSLDLPLSQLAEYALVVMEPNQITLTPIGRKRARGLLRRHRLVERHFTDVLGLDWARSHDEADRFEHLLSPDAETQLADQLGNPDTCPHGNPIPLASNDTTHASQKSLADCKSHTRAIIARIGLETSATLQHLATLGLLPNVEIAIENHAPFNGPILVRVGRAHYALGRDLAKRIWVNESQ